jgi:two-component system cell cycle sensor histidine kinase PleC
MIWVPMDNSADPPASSGAAAAEPLAAALLEACPDAVIVVGEGWHPLAWNRRFAQLWQIDPDKGTRAVWRRIRRRLVDKPGVLAAWRGAAGGEWRATVLLADARWIEIRMSCGRSGVTPCRSWFCRDVTEATLRERAQAEATCRDIALLKRHEEQLKAAMIEAMTANKAKSEFLANMSHELRTPLNAIIGFSEMMQTEIFGPLANARYCGYIADIHASGEHLLNIINTVLDLARVEAGKIVLSEGAVEIDGLIRACASLMRERLVRGGLRLILHIESDLPLLRADPMRLKQILLNLLSNAIKFTEPGGRVTIRAKSGEGGLKLEIADTGIGMDPLDIPLAFEPFSLVHSAHSRAHEGTGLGLPLSRALVEQHGGKLTLASVPGRGTTATVTLPAARFIRVMAGSESTNIS